MRLNFYFFRAIELNCLMNYFKINIYIFLEFKNECYNPSNRHISFIKKIKK